MQNQVSEKIQYDITIKADEVKVIDNGDTLTLQIPTLVYESHKQDNFEPFILDIQNRSQLKEIQQKFSQFFINLIHQQKLQHQKNDPVMQTITRKDSNDNDFLQTSKNTSQMKANQYSNHENSYKPSYSNDKPVFGNNPFQQSSQNTAQNTYSQSRSNHYTQPQPQNSYSGSGNSYMNTSFNGNVSLGNRYSSDNRGSNPFMAVQANQNNNSSLFGDQAPHPAYRSRTQRRGNREGLV